jgi:hypothetical protein
MNNIYNTAILPAIIVITRHIIIDHTLNHTTNKSIPASPLTQNSMNLITATNNRFHHNRNSIHNTSTHAPYKRHISLTVNKSLTFCTIEPPSDSKVFLKIIRPHMQASLKSPHVVLKTCWMKIFMNKPLTVSDRNSLQALYPYRIGNLVTSMTWRSRMIDAVNGRLFAALVIKPRKSKLDGTVRA